MKTKLTKVQKGVLKVKGNSHEVVNMKKRQSKSVSPQSLIKSGILLFTIMLLLLATEATAQIFSDSKQRYKPQAKPSKQCSKLGKNREQPRGNRGSTKKSKPYEYKAIGTKLKEHPSEKKYLISTALEKERIKYVDNSTDVKKQTKNHLPEPVSDKHTKIRDEVERTLQNKKDSEPIEVEPLFFITGHEEFAFMDMEPFLKAVEFALHGRMILIEGHTDNMGNDDANLKLSMRRVARIKQLMVDIGVEENLISVIGYGEAEPKYDNNTEDGRQRNRRVDFKVF